MEEIEPATGEDKVVTKTKCNNVNVDVNVIATRQEEGKVKVKTTQQGHTSNREYMQNKEV